MRLIRQVSLFGILSIICVGSYKLKTKSTTKIDDIKSLYDDDEYGDVLFAINAAQSKVEAKENEEKEKKDINLLSEIYSVPSQPEISTNAGNLLKDNENSKKSFEKLNRIADIYGGKEALKSNETLKNTLKVLLSNNTKSHSVRIMAAKLSSRLYDIPVTYQMTEGDKKNPPKNLNSYIAVPRARRLYQPDYYIENFKAGNWEP